MFGSLMGATHFRLRTLEKVSAEMSRNVASGKPFRVGAPQDDLAVAPPWPREAFRVIVSGARTE
jgi:hypothetical protein